MVWSQRRWFRATSGLESLELRIEQVRLLLNEAQQDEIDEMLALLAKIRADVDDYAFIRHRDASGRLESKLPICRYPNCAQHGNVRGLCRRHYVRWPYYQYCIQGIEWDAERTNIGGYIECRVDDIWAMRSRLVMGRHMHAVLTSSQQVRHRDGNKQNDELANLEIIER